MLYQKWCKKSDVIRVSSVGAVKKGAFWVNLVRFVLHCVTKKTE